jgi:hypothetical protein
MMNYSNCIIGSLIFASTVASSQDLIKTQPAATLAKEIVRNQSNSDAVTFGGYLSAAGQFVGKDGNTVTFQPRIYDLDKIFGRKNIEVDTNYARTAWERNLQINAGITPNAKNLFGNPENFQMGFTFAIINNKEIPLEDFQSVMDSYQMYAAMQTYLTEQIHSIGNDTIKTMVMKMVNHQDYSCLPKFLQDSVEKKFGHPISTMMDIPKNLMDSLSHILPRRPQFIADVNAIHGLGNRGEAGLDFKISFSSYLFAQKKAGVDPQLNLSVSYSFADDMARSNVNINRRSLDIAAGINIIFFSRFDLKPGISCTNIFSGRYADERVISYSPTVSFLVKIAEKIVVAINWRYNSDMAASIANFKLKTSLE